MIQFVAEDGGNNFFGDTRTGGMAGPIGLFIIVVLAIALVLLIRNMNKRIKRLPAEFPGQGGPSAVSADPAVNRTSAEPDPPGSE